MLTTHRSTYLLGREVGKLFPILDVFTIVYKAVPVGSNLKLRGIVKIRT